MKKLITFIILLFTTITFSQSETYVKTYKGYITEISDIKSGYEESRAVVIFHPGGRNEFVVNVNSATVRYFQISNPEKTKNDKGVSYQIVECIKENTGKIVQLHIYPETLRIYIENDYIEFLNN
jgi:hypothetical protein